MLELGAWNFAAPGSPACLRLRLAVFVFPKSGNRNRGESPGVIPQNPHAPFRRMFIQRESIIMNIFIIIGLVCLVPIAWFWYKWFWSKPVVFKRRPARTWPPNRTKTAPKPRFVVPF
jgi:hypothetical protein